MANRNKAKTAPAQQKESLVQRLLPARSVRRVVVVFLLLLTVPLSAIPFTGGWTGWIWITSTTARIAGAGARAVGVGATVEGNLILLPSRTLVVDPQCTAFALMAVYTALVLAYPVSRGKRFLALAIGLPLLQIVNMIRIVGAAYASEVLADKSFCIVHDYVFEFGMSFLVFVMWAVWLSSVRRGT